MCNMCHLFYFLCCKYPTVMPLKESDGARLSKLYSEDDNSAVQLNENTN